MNLETSRDERTPIDRTRVEVVERKGLGHPDTLADTIAEMFSMRYSQWTEAAFGYVPHHWVDKCMVIGGESRNDFGDSAMVQPITVLVVGKVTDRVGSTQIPLADIAAEATHRSLGAVLYDFGPSDCVVKLYTNTAVGSGRPSDWYRPATALDFEDLAPANDTVTCSAYAPLSDLEQLVMALEQRLNGPDFKAAMPHTGTDIKILATRVEDDVDLTLCVPAIARLTPSRSFYDSFKQAIIEQVRDLGASQAERFSVRVRLNTRDTDSCVYMTHHGSAIDTGDVGVVGRGNRLNGVISPMRETGLEAPWGKNPTYHAGKIYTVLAQRIAEQVHLSTGLEVGVNITSDNGRPLQDPRFVSVSAAGAADVPRELVDSIVNRELALLPDLCRRFWDSSWSNVLLPGAQLQRRDATLWGTKSLV